MSDLQLPGVRGRSGSPGSPVGHESQSWACEKPQGVQGLLSSGNFKVLQNMRDEARRSVKVFKLLKDACLSLSLNLHQHLIPSNGTKRQTCHDWSFGGGRG